MTNKRGWAETFNEFATRVHEENYKWWHDENGVRLVRNKGEMIALMHSELSEMLEGVRKSGVDDHLPNRISEEVELADLLIRAFDYAAGHGLDLGGAIVEKMEYNKRRADHTYAARKAAGGKKF